MLSGAPMGLAMTTNASPLRFEANHLKPLRRQASPSGVAVVSRAPRSEPPVRSVKNWPVWPIHSPESILESTRSRMSRGANCATWLATIPASAPIAQDMPISAWLSM